MAVNRSGQKENSSDVNGAGMVLQLSQTSVQNVVQEWMVILMLIITIEVDAPAALSMAVKERLAMDVEKYGDTRVIDVKVVDKNDGCKRIS